MNKIYFPSDQDRMFTYAWYEKTDESVTKFGEHWVKAGADPYKECYNRIRQSLGTRKDIYDDGTVVPVAIWDVSEYAKGCDKFRPKSKVDDHIRSKVGFVKQNETHNLHHELLIEKVDEILRSVGQPRPEVTLSTAQYNDTVQVVEWVGKGYKRILAELAARYGKTIWSSVVAMETGFDLTIVTSYVLTSFTSFKNDIRKFQQFQEVEVVDMAVDGYDKVITEYLTQGRKVFAFLSLHKGGKRDRRMSFLRSLNLPKLWIVDEADYGAHTTSQVDILKKTITDEDTLILMTGTNADRASADWPIDKMLSTTYFELLINKSESMNLVVE